MIQSRIILLIVLGVFLTGCANTEMIVTKAPEVKMETNPSQIITITPDPIVSPLIINNVVKTDTFEIIHLKNISDQNLNLVDFVLVDTNGEKLKRFSSEIILRPDEEYKILNGDNFDDSIEFDEIWADEIILTQPNDEIIITNQAGRILWTYTYKLD